MFLDLYSNIELYNNAINTSSSSYIDTSDFTTTLNNWITSLTNYRDGVYIDYDQNIKSDMNYLYSLGNLN
jgi:accessory colonization factor AcfC